MTLSDDDVDDNNHHHLHFHQLLSFYDEETFSCIVTCIQGLFFLYFPHFLPITLIFSTHDGGAWKRNNCFLIKILPLSSCCFSKSQSVSFIHTYIYILFFFSNFYCHWLYFSCNFCFTL